MEILTEQIWSYRVMMPGIRSSLKFATTDRIKPMLFLDAVKPISTATRELQSHIS
jgi:hypothetical protein